MSKPVIAFIGAGNMANAIIGGLVQSGYPANRIWASNRTQPKLDQLLGNYKINTTLDNQVAADRAEVLVLAVKPQMMADVVKDLYPKAPAKPPIILSIAAGLTVEMIKEMFEFEAPVVRAMPNTPSLLREGVSGLYADATVTAEQRHICEDILNACGITLWVEQEDMINTVISVAGSSPAYFFLFMEAMVAKAVAMGLSPEDAHRLTVQTALGSARMAKESGLPPAQLKQNVMSKGGATEKAVEAFEAFPNGGVRTMVEQAMQAAYDRAEEMAKLLASK